MKSGNTCSNNKSSNKYSNVTNNHNYPSKKSNHSNLYEVDKSGISRRERERENNISNTFTTHNLSSNTGIGNNHSYLNQKENPTSKSGGNGNSSHSAHNSNKKNNKSNGLGNSLFKGQKFIDFQEPFNDTIRPVRDKGSTCTGTIMNDTNALNSPLRNSGEINWNEDLLYGTENVKLEQIEIRDNIDVEYLERGIDLNNKYNEEENNFEINYNEDFNTNNVRFNRLENDNTNFSNISNSNTGNNLKEVSSTSLNSNNTNISPINIHKDHLLKNSKYFNNLNVPSNCNAQQLNINNIDYNLVSSTATKNNQVNSGTKSLTKSNLHDNNRSTYSPIKPQSNPGSNENVSNLDFINTLMRLKSGLKLDTSTTYIPNNNNFGNTNYGNNLPNNDESKSYIKEILDMCSGSESKMNEISNLESRNFDDAGENNSNSNSMISGNNTNFNSFLNIGIGFDNFKGNIYNHTGSHNHNFQQNNLFNLQAQSQGLGNTGNGNIINNIQSGSGNKNTINLNFQNNLPLNTGINAGTNSNFIQQPKSLKVDDLIEITNKRKNMISSGTSNNAYLRRRHLETLSKLEKMKKEKEEREIGDQKFHPVINRKSKEMAHKMSRQSLCNISKSSDKLPHVNPGDIRDIRDISEINNLNINNNFEQHTKNKLYSETPYAFEDSRKGNHYYHFPADNDLILSERENKKDNQVYPTSSEKESKTERVLPSKEFSKSENKMVNISHIRQDTKDILSQIDNILLEEKESLINKDITGNGPERNNFYRNNENIYIEKIRNTNEIRQAYRSDKNRRNSSGSIRYEKKERLKSDIIGNNLIDDFELEQNKRERAFSPSPYHLIRNNKFEGYYHPELNDEIHIDNKFTTRNNNLINSPEKNIQKNAKNFNAKNNLNLNSVTNQIPNQGAFKLEINNKIYLPPGANYNDYNNSNNYNPQAQAQPQILPQPNTADKIEKARPNLDFNSQINKHFILTSSDLVNYGTKPHKSTNEIKILDNIKIHNSENTMPNIVTTAGNNIYETNKNFVFSYDSNKILQEKNVSSKEPKEKIIQSSTSNTVSVGGAPINIFNYNLPSPIAYSAQNQILDTIPTQQGDEILLTLSNPSAAVDHVEINLFETSLNNQNSAREKNSTNLKISSGNNNQATAESRSFVQLFPVFDKPDFKMQNDQNNQEDFIINENSLNTRPLNTSTNIFSNNNAKETGFKYNYNTHLNSDLISVNNSNNNSECNDYGHDIHKKQNESANINLFCNTYNTGSTSNLNNNQVPTHRQSNTSTSNNENISLNFSKFTNFVGMSEQYSKRTFSSNAKGQNTNSSNSNRIFNNNYYNNILSKKSERGGNTSSNINNQISPNIPTNNSNSNNLNVNVNDISNRNMINSYLDNENQSSHNLLNKNPSNKSIGKCSNVQNIVGNNSNNKIHSIINENLISEDDVGTKNSIEKEKVSRGSFVEKIEKIEKVERVDRRSFVENFDRGSFVEKGENNISNFNQIGNRNYNTINTNTLLDNININSDLKKINYFEKDNLLVSTSSIASGNNKNIKQGKDKVNLNPNSTEKMIKDIKKIESNEEVLMDERLTPEDLKLDEYEINLNNREIIPINNNLDNRVDPIEKQNFKSTNDNLGPSISAVIDEILKPKYMFNKKVNYEKPKTNPFIKKNETMTVGFSKKKTSTSRSLSKNRIEKDAEKNINTGNNIKIKVNDEKENKNFRKKKSKSNSRSKTKTKGALDTNKSGNKKNNLNTNIKRKTGNDRKSNIVTRDHTNNKSLTPVKTSKKNNSNNLPNDYQNNINKNININVTQSPNSISKNLENVENKTNLNKTTDILDVDSNLSSNIISGSNKVNNIIKNSQNSQNFSEKSAVTNNNNNFLSNTSLTSIPPQIPNFIIEKQDTQDYLPDDTKPISTKNNNSSSNINYDYSKFSLDIMNTNASNGNVNANKSSNNLPQNYSYMNEIVSNTIKMHRKSQENCQKQINELLNKIKISQEEHEANLKKDLNNLNMNESSISNMLKDGLSTSMKYEYEAELDNKKTGENKLSSMSY